MAKSTTSSANRKHPSICIMSRNLIINARARARACVYTRVYERPIELTCDCTAVSELCLAAENARDFPADRSNRAVSWTNARPARSSIMVTDRKLRRNVQ